MKIRGEALELALRIVLSCPCPVTSDEERQVFEYLRGLTPGEVADYAPVLAIFAATDTPFHGLADFTGWMAAAGTEATIEREHVLRCNASSYHWQLAAASLPSHSRHVSSVSCWLLSHMVIPVALATAADGSARAEYIYEGGAATFGNVFLPPEFDPGASPVWALHLGAVVSPLSSLRRRSSRSWARRIRSSSCTAAASRGSTTPTSSSWATTGSSAARATRRSGATVADMEARLRLEDLLGRHVRYKGEEGHVVEGHSAEGRSGDESSVVVGIRGAHNVPRRNVTVPESEWGELELLP